MHLRNGCLRVVDLELRQATAIHNEASSGDPFRHVTGEEQNRVRHILGSAYSAERAIRRIFHELFPAFAKLTALGSKHLSVNLFRDQLPLHE